MNDLKPKQIQFYAQEQIAGLGEEGTLFILTFLDNRLLYTEVGINRKMTLVGRKIFMINNKGEMTAVDFERNKKIKFSKTDSPSLSSTSLSTDKIVTGHKDGSIRIYDFKERVVRVLEGHSHPVVALDSDYFGRIYSASSDQFLKKWDLEKGEVSEITGLDGNISQIELFPKKKILIVTKKDIRSVKEKNYMEDIIISDLEDLSFQSFPSPMQNKLSSIHVNPDGRILGTYSSSAKKTETTLVLISANKKSWEFQNLDSHGRETKDSLIMGPKLITCGIDLNNNSTIRLWGTDIYVRNELNKLIVLSDKA
jgi:WD40 repeat protein